MSVRVADRLLRSWVRILPKHGCLSVIGLITRPEETLTWGGLDPQGLSHQIKYNVRQSGRSLVEITGSNSTEAWMSAVIGLSSRGVDVCKWGSPDPPGAVTPNKIQYWLQRPLTCWYRGFEFHRGMDVRPLSGWSLVQRSRCVRPWLTGAVTPNKIECRSEWPLSCWDCGFEFQLGMDVSLLAGWSLVQRSRCVWMRRSWPNSGSHAK